MSENADEHLRRQLIRNFNDAELRARTARAAVRHALRAAGRAAPRRASSAPARRTGARQAQLPVPPAPCAGRDVHRARRRGHAARRGRDAAGEGRRRGVHPAGPDYPHQFINTSDAPMKYLSISTQEQPEICEYPDSGKYRRVRQGLSRHAARERHSTTGTASPDPRGRAPPQVGPPPGAPSVRWRGRAASLSWAHRVSASTAPRTRSAPWHRSTKSSSSATSGATPRCATRRAARRSATSAWPPRATGRTGQRRKAGRDRMAPRGVLRPPGRDRR